jgi:hypothetical protein
VAATGERARDETTVAWITAHRDALLAAGGLVALVILWVADLSWLGLLLVLALAAAYAIAVYRIGTPPEALPGAPPPEPPAARREPDATTRPA